MFIITTGATQQSKIVKDQNQDHHAAQNETTQPPKGNKSQSAWFLACKEHTGDLQNTSGKTVFPTGPLTVLFEQQVLAIKKCSSYTSMYFGPEHNHCWIIDSCDWRVGEQTSQEQGIPKPSYCRWTVQKCRSAPSGENNDYGEADAQTVIYSRSNGEIYTCGLAIGHEVHNYSYHKAYYFLHTVC